MPRDHWLEAWEREAILALLCRTSAGRLPPADLHADGRRRRGGQPSHGLSRPHGAGCFDRWNRTESSKNQGFVQPLAAHEHWHVDISYVNVCGTFYYLVSVLDGCSRFLVHWELRESMKEADVEIVLQRAREKFPAATPRIITDNGPQFIARDFKEFIRLCGMTHVKTSPYYPQIERQDRALARHAEGRLPATQRAALARRCAAAGRRLRGALQS